MVIAELRNQKVGVCVSGGLDSRTITKKMVEMGVNVTCFTADLGQPDEKDINDIKTKMAPCGAETIIGGGGIDAIVLGGGLSKIARLYERVPQLWGRYIFSESDSIATKLLSPRYGDSSGVRGAAWLWPEGE